MGYPLLNIKDVGSLPQKEGICPSGMLSRFFILLVKGYQYCISPLFPPSCRYTPTCSQYALEAIARYGPLKGLYLALRRILRCHPFARGGYDPVK